MRLLTGNLAMTALLALVASAPVFAQVGTTSPETNLDLQFRVGLNWTDNLGRETNGESETFGSAGATVEFIREAARLRAALAGEIDYLHYDSNRFDNEVIGRIDGLIGIALLPQRLDWMIENRFGQVRTDPFAAESPENREYLNVFETGPDLYLPLGVRTALEASGRFADRRLQNSDELDSQIVSGEAGLFRQLSPTQRAGLSATARTVEYDGEDLPRYKLYSAFFTYERQLATGEVGIDLGANRLGFTGRSSTGALVRARWIRELTARSMLSLSAGREFRDAGDQLGAAGLVGTGLGTTGDAGLTADPYTSTYGSATYTLERDRTVFTLGGGASSERYEAANLLDRNTLFVDAGMRYSFSRTLEGELGFSVRREDFTRVDAATADEFIFNAGLARRVGREFDITFQYQYAQRDADVGFDFEENRIIISLVWVPGRR